MKEKFKFKNLIILVLCVVFLCGFIKQQSAMSRIKKETKEKSQELQEVKKENEKLTEEANMSETEEYHEKLAREKLNMIKDGEKSVEKPSSGSGLIEESSTAAGEGTSDEENNSNSNNN